MINDPIPAKPRGPRGKYKRESKTGEHLQYYEGPLKALGRGGCAAIEVTDPKHSMKNVQGSVSAWCQRNWGRETYNTIVVERTVFVYRH